MDFAELISGLLEMGILGVYICLIVLLSTFLFKVPRQLRQIVEAHERTARALEWIAGAIERKEMKERNVAWQASKQTTTPQNHPTESTQQ